MGVQAETARMPLACLSAGTHVRPPAEMRCPSTAKTPLAVARHEHSARSTSVLVRPPSTPAMLLVRVRVRVRVGVRVRVKVKRLLKDHEPVARLTGQLHAQLGRGHARHVPAVRHQPLVGVEGLGGAVEQLEGP
eukprot:scaffold77139_cov61-Phaeocystis_antarctica.AAC.3